MGKPKRLRKAEKDILFQASYPKIEFKYAKNTILNIQTTLQGYCAELFILKSLILYNNHEKEYFLPFSNIFLKNFPYICTFLNIHANYFIKEIGI